MFLHYIREDESETAASKNGETQEREGEKAMRGREEKKKETGDRGAQVYEREREREGIFYL